jgi:hypothetical protein
MPVAAGGPRGWVGAGEPPVRVRATVALVDLLTAAEPMSWSEIPAVRIIGAILGVLLLIAAIRTMFGGKGRR